jgi:hypothetical protein
MSAPSQPYGPGTPAVRRFLVHFAGLGVHDRARVVAAYDAARITMGWQRAEQLLAVTIERSGREAARDALSGPLLQLVRHRRADAVTDAPTDATHSTRAHTDDESLADIDAVAEPALAALLALLVRDLIEAAAFDTLVAPFDGVLAIDGRPSD